MEEISRIREKVKREVEEHDAPLRHRNYHEDLQKRRWAANDILETLNRHLLNQRLNFSLERNCKRILKNYDHLIEVMPRKAGVLEPGSSILENIFTSVGLQPHSAEDMVRTGLNIEGNSFSLSWKNLRDSAAAFLLEASSLRKHFDDLIVINFKGNHLNDKSSRIIAKHLLVSFSHLRELLLAYNEIGDVGLRRLIRAAKSRNRSCQMNALKLLELCNNRPTTEFLKIYLPNLALTCRFLKI